MRRLLAVLLAALMAMSMISMAAAQDKTELDMRALIWKYDDTYGSTVRAAMDKWAAIYSEELGIQINLTMYDAADDMAKQIEHATLICGEKPDFVIINLAEVANGKILVDMFQEAGIPFLFYNKQPAEETVQEVLVDTGTIFIGTLARQAGDMQGEILADLVAADPSIDKNGDGKLQYVMLKGEANNDEAIARTRYSVETAEANGLVMEQLGDTLVCNWDQAQAQAQAPAAAPASPGDDLIERIRQLAELIRSVVGYRGAITWNIAMPDGTPKKLTDVTRLHALGWHHGISLEQGVRSTYEWYTQHANRA